MPALTDAQSYAAEIMRSLRCIRRGHIHWMIGRKFPFLTPEKIMRQLTHVLPSQRCVSPEYLNYYHGNLKRRYLQMGNNAGRGD